MKKTTAPLYACMPRSLLTQPPIRHRNSDDKHQLAPFEFAVAMGLCRAARLELDRQHNATAYQHGGKPAIERERFAGEDFKRDWREVRKARRRGQHAPAPQRWHTHTNRLDYKPGDRETDIKRAGSAGFKTLRDQLRQRPPPDLIEISMTRSAILRSAGLPANGANLDRLDCALDRLCGEVGDMEALLRDWRELPSGQLALSIYGDWLEPPYVRVPLPVPLGAGALSLFLFALGVDTGPVKNTTVPWCWLRQHLGLPHKDANRALSDALRYLNFHLGRLDAEALHRQNVNVPQRYDIKGASELRIVAIPRRWRDDDYDEMPERHPVPKFKRKTRPPLRSRSAAPTLEEFKKRLFANSKLRQRNEEPEYELEYEGDEL